MFPLELASRSAPIFSPVEHHRKHGKQRVRVLPESSRGARIHDAKSPSQARAERFSSGGNSVGCRAACDSRHPRRQSVRVRVREAEADVRLSVRETCATGARIKRCVRRCCQGGYRDGTRAGADKSRTLDRIGCAKKVCVDGKSRRAGEAETTVCVSRQKGIRISRDSAGCRRPFCVGFGRLVTFESQHHKSVRGLPGYDLPAVHGKSPIDEQTYIW